MIDLIYHYHPRSHNSPPLSQYCLHIGLHLPPTLLDNQFLFYKQQFIISWLCLFICFVTLCSTDEKHQFTFSRSSQNSLLIHLLQQTKLLPVLDSVYFIILNSFSVFNYLIYFLCFIYSRTLLFENQHKTLNILTLKTKWIEIKNNPFFLYSGYER